MFIDTTWSVLLVSFLTARLISSTVVNIGFEYEIIYCMFESVPPRLKRLAIATIITRVITERWR
jgi:hypothetical protein